MYKCEGEISAPLKRFTASLDTRFATEFIQEEKTSPVNNKKKILLVLQERKDIVYNTGFICVKVGNIEGFVRRGLDLGRCLGGVLGSFSGAIGSSWPG